MSGDKQRALTRQKETCVFIVGPSRRGTGYLIAPRHVVTAWHVVEDWRPEEWYTVAGGEPGSGWSRQARLLSHDEQHDAAVLELQGDEAPVPPLPVGTHLDAHAEWTCFGFPVAMDAANQYQQAVDEAGMPQAGGLPLSGRVEDVSIRDDLFRGALLLSAPWGGHTPLAGFSGSAVVVRGGIVGHLTRHIPGHVDGSLAAFSYVYACPIGAVLELLDFQPAARSVAAPEEVGSDAHFDAALQSIELPVQPPPPSPLAGSVRGDWLALVLDPPSQDEWKARMVGDNVKGAQKRLSDASISEQKAHDLLRARANRTLKEVRDTEQRMEGIARERPPQEPIYRSLPADAPSSHQQMQHEQYLRAHQAYQAEKGAFEQRQASLLALRLELKALQDRAKTAEIELSNRQAETALALGGLRRDVEEQRGRDALALLLVLRDEATRLDPGDEALDRLVRMLLVRALGHGALPWAGASGQDITHLIAMVDADIELYVSQAHMAMGRDFLQRCAILVDATRTNRQKLDHVRSLLDEAPEGAVELALAKARTWLSQPLMEGPPNSLDLVSPREILDKAGEFDQAAQALDSHLAHGLEWFETHKAVSDQAGDLHRRAALEQRAMGSLADQLAAPLHGFECIVRLLRTLPVHAASLKMTSKFLAALHRETDRRFHTTAQALITSSATHAFHVVDARAVLAGHATGRLLSARDALTQRMTEIRARRKSFEASRARVLSLPARNRERYRIRWLWSAGTVLLPIVNLCGACLFLFDLSKLQEALASDNGHYRELRVIARRVSMAALLLGLVLGLALAGLWRYPLGADGLTDVDALALGGAAITYFLAAALYLVAVVRLTPRTGAR